MCKKLGLFNLLLLIVYLPSCLQKALDAKQYLFVYGFLGSPNPDDKAMKDGIEKFEKAMGLEITGSLNENTLAKMSSPRCGMPSNSAKFVPAKWRKSELTFKIHNWTETFTKSQIKKVFHDSITRWTEKVNLRITESSSDNADINVYFTPENGPLSFPVLAYAYYPENGTIYFTEDQDWTLKPSLASSKIYFDWAAAHELGHSLGLDHSNTTRSIMFPHYSAEILQPSDNDVNNLRRLYDQAFDQTILCKEASISAMLNIDDKIIIKGKQFWRLSGASVKSGPFFLDLIFPGLPDTIDAAFAVRKTVYFFKDNIFYRFKPNKQTPTRKLISIGFEGMPSGLNAAFFESSTGIIYFFKGSKYYAFDTTKATGKRLTVSGKSIANDWNGIPNNVEAAILIETNKALFIKNSRCYTIDTTSRKLLSNQDCKTTLFKC